MGLVIENTRILLPFTLGRLLRIREPKFRVPGPDTITTTFAILFQTEAGPILEILFNGKYPPGSFGNEHAASMREAASRAIQEQRPAAVLFNLRSLNYVWGDSICGLANTTLDPTTKTFLPSCVFAVGRTATALEGLFTGGWVFNLAGMKLFREHDAAVEYLSERLKGMNGRGDR